MGGCDRSECSATFSTSNLVSGLDLETFQIKSRNVAKLAHLIDGMATALQVAPSRVRTAAAQLRKHKLLTTGPRGPGAPDMSPEDATNLLLAVMFDGELGDAHSTVVRLRAAKVRFCDGNRYTDGRREEIKSLPENGFITSEAGRPYELGSVIDILLDAWVRYHSVDEGDDEDIDLDPQNITLEITSPGYQAMLKFNTPHGLFWRIAYEWKSPEQLAYEEATRGDRFKTVWESRNGPYMWSSRTVGEDSLTRIAECLRGSEWDYGCAEFQPPYASNVEVRNRESVPA
jgi:hypothetical protein